MKMIKNLVQRERWGSLRYEMLLLVSESNTRPQSVYSRPLSDVSVTPSIDPYRFTCAPDPNSQQDYLCMLLYNVLILRVRNCCFVTRS